VNISISREVTLGRRARESRKVLTMASNIGFWTWDLGSANDGNRMDKHLSLSARKGSLCNSSVRRKIQKDMLFSLNVHHPPKRIQNGSATIFHVDEDVSPFDVHPVVEEETV